MSIPIRCLPVLACLALLGSPAFAQLNPESRYNGVSRPIRVQIDVPEEFNGEPSVLIVRAGADPATGQRAPVEAGAVDLAGLFPVLWTTNAPAVMYAQLYLGEQSVGAPLVLEPMLTPVRSRNGFEDLLVKSAEGKDEQTLNQLARQPATSIAARKSTVERVEPGERVFSGYRIRVKRDVVFETDFGTVRIATRPDHAPRASATFVELAEGGFYDGVVFHRVMNDDGRGRPFVIQAGDPSGHGWGGSGEYIDFERSALPHDFGVLSAARHPYDPNTNGSQFFICLSREACAPLDGLYTSFAEVVEGAAVIDSIRLLDVIVEGEGENATPTQRPVEPAMIRDAYTEPSPPIDAFRTRATLDAGARPIDR